MNMEDQRKYTRRKDYDDHELLLILESRVENLESKFHSLCLKIDAISVNQAVNHGEILKRLDQRDDKYHELCEEHKKQINNSLDNIKESKVPWKTFKWVFGGVMSTILGAMIFTAGMSYDTRQYLERHIMFSEMVYYQVTGQKWNDVARSSLLKAKKDWELYRNGDADLHDLPDIDKDDETQDEN
jgi:hypothetical protein